MKSQTSSPYRSTPGDIDMDEFGNQTSEIFEMICSSELLK